MTIYLEWPSFDVHSPVTEDIHTFINIQRLPSLAWKQSKEGASKGFHYVSNGCTVPPYFQ